MAKKPLKGRNYGRIPHLSTSNLGSGDHYMNLRQEHLITKKKRDKIEEVLAFEKYDGINVGILRKGDEIIPLTRKGYAANTSPYKMHHYFHDWVMDKKDKWLEILHDGERLVGEWLMVAHGIRYAITREPIVFFDHFGKSGKRSPYDYLILLGVKHKLPLARLLHRGDAIDPENLLEKLNKGTRGIQAVEGPEGIVYRLERRGKTLFLGKWVRPNFKAGQYNIGKSIEDRIYNKKPNDL